MELFRQINIPDTMEKADNYKSDPSNPIPSISGHSLLGGAADQRINEIRSDILVYNSPILEEEVEVTGYIKASIYASTSCTDTDFFMKLIDVNPDGVAYNISSGGRRARYLKNGRTNPQALNPGEIIKWDIELKATSNIFKKGHRIRIEISSTDFPNTDINPNCFIDLSKCTKKNYLIADQTIYHDKDYPSMIELPIIPLKRKKKLY